MRVDGVLLVPLSVIVVLNMSWSIRIAAADVVAVVARATRLTLDVRERAFTTPCLHSS